MRRVQATFVILTLALSTSLTGSASARDFRSAAGISAQTGSVTFAARNNQRASAGGATSGSELSMIQLQSVVSRRQQDLQLTTGMMNSMNQANKGIIGNMCRTC
jgi:hypothetical protein